MTHNNWNGFVGGAWQDEINVRDFIQKNYKEYTGDDSFLAGPTARTTALMEKLQELFALERERGGVLEMRKHIAWYVSGMRGASGFRRRVTLLEGSDRVREALLAYMEEAEREA